VIMEGKVPSQLTTLLDPNPQKVAERTDHGALLPLSPIPAASEGRFGSLSYNLPCTWCGCDVSLYSLQSFLGLSNLQYEDMTFTNGIQTKGVKQQGPVQPLSQDLALLPIPLLSTFTNREASDGTMSSSVPRSKEPRNPRCLTTSLIFYCLFGHFASFHKIYEFCHLF
jgi:hypothetical protein